MSEASETLPASARKVQAEARRLGLAVTIREMPASTRTAEDAAAACGCEVAQIAKTLVFRGAESGRPCLILVSGANRFNEEGAAVVLGESMARPDAAFVREVTGFAIGGIPPFGHVTPMPVFMDEDLMRYETVWAAGGTPRAVFPISPGALADATHATIIKVT